MAGKLDFSFETFDWINLSDKLLFVWSKAYPLCDIQSELNKAASWLVANPTKRKSNYNRFMNNWLSRAHERKEQLPKNNMKDLIIEEKKKLKNFYGK